MSQDELFPGARVEREVREVNSAANRHELFIAAYLSNGHNATAAAIAAGYSEKTAKSQGSRLLTNVDIAEKLANGAKNLVTPLVASAEEVLQSVSMTMRFDVRRMVSKSGAWKSVSELDDCEAHAIEGVDFDKQGGIKKFKMASRAGAQDKLMRHHSLYADKVEHSGAVTLVSHVPRPDAAERDRLRGLAG